MGNETTGLTPYEMVYGKEGRGPLQVLWDSWTDKIIDGDSLNESAVEYIKKLKNDLKLCNKVAVINAKHAQRQFVEQFNLPSRQKSFDVGDQFLVLLPDFTNKLQSARQGLAFTSFKMFENSYTVEMPNRAIRNLHANHLREFNQFIPNRHL